MFRVCSDPQRWGLLRSVAAGSFLLTAIFAFTVSVQAGSDPGWLGVYAGRQTGNGETGASDAGPTGVPLAGVVADSPAARAGIRAQDRILAVDGRTVASFADLKSALREIPADRWVQITVRRSGNELVLDARLTEQPADKRLLRARKGWIGAHAIDLPSSLRLFFGAPPDAGVLIHEVESASPAFTAGLEVGDVVYQIGDFLLGHASDLQTRVERGGIGNTIEIVLVRAGAEITLEATIEEALAKRVEGRHEP
jgi:S1-C subfamily serine protease